jgi:CBS domain-containing protein
MPWSAVTRIERRRIAVRAEDLAPEPPVDVWLRQAVLDDQVIDVNGAKVIRVNDLQMLHAEGRMLLVHVDVGTAGILRRLGWARAVNGLLRWLFDYTPKDALVSWRFVELVGPSGPAAQVRMSKLAALARLRPAELADIMEQLGTAERESLLDALPLSTAADTLEEADPDVQRAYLGQQEPGEAADLLEEMTSTEAADVLRVLPGPEAEIILGRMEPDAMEEIRSILDHEEDTAGGVMSTRCLEMAPEEAAGRALEKVRALAEEVDILNQIYVLGEERRLLGVLSLRELLLARPEAPLRSVMTSDVVSVRPEAGLDAVAAVFVKYGFRAVPVVDPAGTFRGAVRLARVLPKLSRFFRP